MSPTRPHWRYRAPKPVLAALITGAVVLASACEVPPATKTAHGSTSDGGSSVADIPANYLALYKTAPRCSGLDWELLAAVGDVETDHGRSPLPGVHSGQNDAGAMGPMQFLQSTFKAQRTRHSDIGPNVYDPKTAITAAAHLLCDSGGTPFNERKALYAYNHSNKYVSDVRAQAKEYSQ